MTNIQENIDAVLQRIAKACNKAQRQPQEVTLLAVTKTVPPELIKIAVAAGQRRRRCWGSCRLSGAIRCAAAARRGR